jgi:hypothetical protein
MGESDCPRCGGEGFVTSQTNGMHEAACLNDDCPIVVFEVDI